MARRFQPIGTPLSKLAGALAYAYLLLLVARLMLPPNGWLEPAQLVAFVALAGAIALNGAERMAGACRRGWGGRQVKAVAAAQESSRLARAEQFPTRM